MLLPERLFHPEKCWLILFCICLPHLIHPFIRVWNQLVSFSWLCGPCWNKQGSADVSKGGVAFPSSVYPQVVLLLSASFTFSFSRKLDTVFHDECNLHLYQQCVSFNFLHVTKLVIFSFWSNLTGMSWFLALILFYFIWKAVMEKWRERERERFSLTGSLLR